MKLIGNKWDEVLAEEYKKDYFTSLLEKVDEEYAKNTVFPPKDKIYSAMQKVDYDKVKVVILGQDPYHEKGQANGMAFAVGEGIQLPPSLVNIYKELESDIGAKPSGSTLIGWAEQGVLLLNTTLTVREGQAQSHSTYGWQTFTDAIIKACSKREKPMAFILWGANAISKKQFIDKRHFVHTSPHPSPLSSYRGFFGSKPFSKVNEFLKSTNQDTIDWLKIEGSASYYYSTGSIKRV